MNHNSYAGREYLSKIINSNVDLDVISIGKFDDENVLENQRCNNLWKPKKFDQLIKNLKHYNFCSLKDPTLIDLLEKKRYDLGIQGGTGIIREEIFNRFNLGIFNFHPGDLPKYRGCSAPEWQLCENQPIIATCHIIDNTIDTGDLYSKKILSVDRSNYFSFRASIYPLIAEFVVEIITEIKENNGFAHELIKQDENQAIYRRYIGDEMISILKKRLENVH